MKITQVGRPAGIAVVGMFMFLAALLPVARAQIVPVSLTKTTAADSKVPSGAVLAPLPHSELRRAVKPALPKTFWVLTAGVYTAAGLDMQRSESMLPERSERWRKIWWVPQVATMAGNLAGYGYTRAHPAPR